MNRLYHEYLKQKEQATWKYPLKPPSPQPNPIQNQWVVLTQKPTSSATCATQTDLPYISQIPSRLCNQATQTLDISCVDNAQQTDAKPSIYHRLSSLFGQTCCCHCGSAYSEL